MENKVNSIEGYNRKGSATLVEMTFVFPIVIVLVVVMLYFGLLNLQRIVVDSYAQRAALFVSRSVLMPGYGEFGDFSINSDFPYSKGTSFPASDKVNNAASYSSSNLYRFLFGNPIDSNYANSIRNTVDRLAQNASILAGDYNCSVSYTREVLTLYIVVTIEQEIKIPGFVQFFGVGNSLIVKSVAMCPALSPTEFIRDVDTVIDVTNNLLKKMGLKTDFSGFIVKVRKKLHEFGFI